MTRRLLLLAASALACAVAGAAASGHLAAQSQSLADLANQGAQQRRDAPTPAKVYTNADVSPAPCDQGEPTAHASSDSEIGARGSLAFRAADTSLVLRSPEEIVKAATPAVVTIETDSATGTGFFVAPGLVLTNRHVVDGASSMRVRFSDGGTSPAFVSSTASEADLALVRVATPPSPQPTLLLDRAKGVQVGEDVLAIGSPLGMLQSTVTRGIVSAVRTVGGVTYVQTDAAINHGNSGGPLIDKWGRVIGITTLKFTSSESLGFAIAAEHALKLIGGDDAHPPASAGCGAVQGVRDDRKPFEKNGGLEAVFNQRQKSDTEMAIEKGAAEFEQAVQPLAREADVIDAWWQRYQAGCGIMPGRHSSDGRDWFGIWAVPAPAHPDDVPNSASAESEARPECRSARASVIEAASSVRTAMAQAEEAARRAGVPPGVVRSVRQKYRMEW
ncbi:MAG TPA: trypsin-like peptidase domain-containing protein [Vicinamibacterales bacterium]|jgi:S1-C subfamily serine protease|nr:trypsin-like peptidase domain-containing protein [Vicinamibacterales bacterium]